MITYQAKEADPQAQLIIADSGRMGTGEFMWRTATHTFGAFNSIGQLFREAELAPYGSVSDVLQSTGLFDDAVQTDPEALREFAEQSEVSREDFAKTREQGGEDLSRGGRIAWFAGMTKTRARLQALELDRRDREALILNRNGDGPLRTAAGFGAAMMAVMVDPINLIPIGGAATKGMRAAERIGTMAKAGVKGALMADAVLLPRAAAMGEEVGPETAFLDTIFGAVFGAGLGSVGAAAHAWRRGKLNKKAADFLNELTEAGIEPTEARRISDSYYDVAADFGEADRAMLDTLRRTLSMEERQKFGLLMDRAVAALAHGEKMDVGRWAEELGLRERMEAIYGVAEEVRRASSVPRRLLFFGDTAVEDPTTGGAFTPSESAHRARDSMRGESHGQRMPSSPAPDRLSRATAMEDPSKGGKTVNSINELGEEVNPLAQNARTSGTNEPRLDFRTERDEFPAYEAQGTRTEEGKISLREGGDARSRQSPRNDGRAEPAAEERLRSDEGRELSEYDHVERAYERMEAEGKTSAEDSAAVLEAQADYDRAERLRDAAYDVFECALRI